MVMVIRDTSLLLFLPTIYEIIFTIVEKDVVVGFGLSRLDLWILRFILVDYSIESERRILNRRDGRAFVMENSEILELVYHSFPVYPWKNNFFTERRGSHSVSLHGCKSFSLHLFRIYRRITRITIVETLGVSFQQIFSIDTNSKSWYTRCISTLTWLVIFSFFRNTHHRVQLRKILQLQFQTKVDSYKTLVRRNYTRIFRRIIFRSVIASREFK